jgi:spermidine synthase
MKRNRIFLYVSTFFIGISASIAQAIMIRELLMLFKGNELSIGIIMVLWFSGITAGAAISKKIKAHQFNTIALNIILHPILFYISLILLYCTPIVYHTFGGFYTFEVELFIALACLFPQCFVVGYIFPVLVNAGSKLKIINAGSVVFLLESIGAFIGGITFTFLIIQKINPLGTALILFIIASIISFTVIQQRIKRLAIVTAIVISAFGIAHAPYLEKKLLTLSFAANHPGTLLEYRRTPYQMMFIARLGDTIALYGNNNLYAQFPDDYQVRPIIHALLSTGSMVKDTDILISGDTAFLHYVFAYAGASIDYVTVDPLVYNIMQQKFISIYPDFPSQLINVYYDDTRSYLKLAHKKYTTIIILPAPPDSILHNRLYTKEFFNDCKLHLSTNGVCIIQIEGFANIMNPSLRRYVASVINSFTQVFPSSLISAGDTIYCIGFNDNREIDVSNYLSQYIKNFSKSSISKTIQRLVPGFNPYELKMYFQESQQKYLSTQLQSEYIVNSDRLPKGYFEYLANSLKQSNSVAQRIITNPLMMTLLLMLIVIISLWYFKSRGTQHIVFGSIIVINGFISMAAMIVALITYQNVYGVLYYKIALCNALFMLGLAIGSVTTFVQKDFFITRIVVLIAGLVMLFCFTIYNNSILFYSSIILIAATTGSFIPLLLNKQTDDIQLLASTLDATDHSGALCGALMTPFVLLPFFGIYSLGILIVLGFCLILFKKRI